MSTMHDIARHLWRGQNVRLNGVTKEDLPVLALWYQDPGFLRLWNADPAKPRSEADLSKSLEEEAKKENAFRFAIRPLEGNDLLGVAEIDWILWNCGTGWVSIGFGDRAHWGKGYGADAMRLLLDYAFSELNLHRVQLTVFAYNERAIALYEKVGFVREGAYREFLYRDGARYDMYLYGLLRREWEARRQVQAPGGGAEGAG